jgi:hypothetical protein
MKKSHVFCVSLRCEGRSRSMWPLAVGLIFGCVIALLFHTRGRPGFFPPVSSCLTAPASGSDGSGAAAERARFATHPADAFVAGHGFVAGPRPVADSARCGAAGSTRAALGPVCARAAAAHSGPGKAFSSPHGAARPSASQDGSADSAAAASDGDARHDRVSSVLVGRARVSCVAGKPGFD